MDAFLAAVIVFALAFLSMGVGVLRGRRCLGCSCKAARRIMKQTGKEAACGQELHQPSDGSDQ